MTKNTTEATIVLYTVKFKWQPRFGPRPTETISFLGLFLQKTLPYIPRKGFRYRYHSQAPGGYSPTLSIIDEPLNVIEGSSEIWEVTVQMTYPDNSTDHPQLETWALDTLIGEYGWKWGE